MGTHLRGKHFPLIASNNGDFFCAAKPECRRRFLIKDYGYYVRHFTRHYTQLCSLPKKQNTSGSCTHLWRKVETVLITAFFFLFFLWGFRHSLRIIIFNKENNINFFIRKKRLFWSFAFQCFVQLRTTIFRSVPIFVKVAHIFSRFCLLDTGNINLHQSTAEKWFSTMVKNCKKANTTFTWSKNKFSV